ncbi:MAG: tetraacyldisaccharide 4'-kinase, partial [Beijerinckiaceae bacterium]|nr:tetraacyldisaccharide 4'-kinase [Beijerinckiaceae bacterium]
PAGPLRAALDAQMARVDALVVIGEGDAGARVAALAKARGLPVATAHLAPDQTAAATLRGRRALAFAGIGRPEKFFETLRGIGVDVVATRAFADHHAYSADDLAAMRLEARRSEAILATTEKDLVRIADAGDIVALPVVLETDQANALEDLVRQALARRAMASL